MGRDEGLSVGYPREVSFVAAITFWVAAVLGSWMLVGAVVGGVLWLVT